MRRRDFITLVGATTVGSTAWLRAAPAQQAGMPVIGFLGLTSPAAFAALTAAFKQGLTEAGFVEHQNVALEYRWAHGQFDQLLARAADLVRQDVNVLAAFGTPASAIAAKCATSTIAVIVDPDSPDTVEQMKELPAAARALGREIKTLDVAGGSDLEAVFATMAKQQIGAVVVTSSPNYLVQREKFVALAARYAIPTVYFVRSFADAGGLMSYGTSFPDAYRQAGVYTGRILKGGKVSDLPVQQSVKVELVINMKTAKSLGLSIPLTLLGRADAVIE